MSETEAVVRSRHAGDVDKLIANKRPIITNGDHRCIVLAAAEGRSQVSSLAVRLLRCPGEREHPSAQDVRRGEMVRDIGITPEAGNTKTGPREMPPHGHLIEQGFLDFVRSKKAGPLSYSVERQRGTSAGNPACAEVGGKLAYWVRAVGVDDEIVQSNHGWRHRFKTIGRAVGLDAAKLDATHGHAPATEGDKYGDFLPNARKLEIDKIARYDVGTEPMRRPKPGARPPWS